MPRMRHILNYQMLPSIEGSFRYWRFWKFGVGDQCQEYELSKFVGTKYTPGGKTYKEYDSAIDKCLVDVDVVSVRSKVVCGDLLLSEALKTIRGHYAYEYYVGMFCRAGSSNDPRWNPHDDKCESKCMEDHGGTVGLKNTRFGEKGDGLVTPDIGDRLIIT